MAPCFYRSVDQDHVAIAVKNKKGVVVAETLVDWVSVQEIKRHTEAWFLSRGGLVVGFSKQLRRRVYLHRVIVSSSRLVRHINQDRLDNRICNLSRRLVRID